tara:strand:- start:3518 stop:4129 length:612 start_codon:yes stop_codon:yes gene_type:complete
MTFISNDFDTRERVNIDIGIRCPLQCPKCSRQEIYKKNNLKIPGKDMSIDIFNKISDHYKKVIFCGQVSDPIHHPKLITFLEILKKKGRETSVHTASGHKSKDWFIKAFKAHTGARWLFGIDGLPSVSNTYRINQDGVKLFNIMLEARKYLELKPVWQYIVMDFNEIYLKECLKIADENNLEIKQVIDRKNLTKGGYIEQFKT